MILLNILWDFDPEIFESIKYLRWYGLCWLTGFIIAYILLRKIYKSEKIPSTELEALLTYALVGSVIGARLGHILFYDPIFYWNNPQEILPFKIYPNLEFTGLTGLASHGVIIGAFVSIYFYSKKYKRNYLWVWDRLAIGASLVFALIRIGNLFNSEIIGKATSLPWAFVFQKVDYVPRHPTQIYEAVLYLFSGVVLYLLWKFKYPKNNSGYIFGIGLIMMGASRFMIEFLKENQVTFEKELFLNMGQILSIPMITLGVILVYYRRKI